MKGENYLYRTRAFERRKPKQRQLHTKVFHGCRIEWIAGDFAGGHEVDNQGEPDCRAIWHRQDAQAADFEQASDRLRRGHFDGPLDIAESHLVIRDELGAVRNVGQGRKRDAAQG